MLPLVASITATVAPEISNKATASVGLDFDFDLLESADLYVALSRYGPKNTGCSRTSFKNSKASILAGRPRKASAVTAASNAVPAVVLR